MESKLEINDIVQIQDTVADVHLIGLLGYVSKVTDTTVDVNFYYSQTKGENAHVMTETFLLSQVYFCGKPNPNLLPL